MRVEIEHNAEGTIARFGKDDVVVRGIVKAAGFRFSRNIDGGPAWYLNSSWGAATRRQRVAQVVARFEADEVSVENPPVQASTAAEREAAQVERAAARAERLGAKAERLDAASDAAWQRSRQLGEHIPFGQPILVGHHSEGKHRRTLAKIEATGRKSAELAREAEATARSAAIAARAADGTPLVTRQRRIERKSAELRADQRELAKADPSSDYAQALRDRIARLVDEISHDQAVVEASGVKVYSKADVNKGDVVVVRGRPRKVARVNAKSVSVETGYSWTDTVPYLEITRVVPAAAAAG